MRGFGDCIGYIFTGVGAGMFYNFTPRLDSASSNGQGTIDAIVILSTPVIVYILISSSHSIAADTVTTLYRWTQQCKIKLPKRENREAIQMM